MEGPFENYLNSIPFFHVAPPHFHSPWVFYIDNRTFMDFKQLFDDYRQGKLTAEERAAFEKLLHNPK